METNRKPDIEFCNDNSACGCRVLARSGEGYYSDSVKVWLCDRHRKGISDDDQKKIHAAELTADGVYEHVFENSQQDVDK
jgi:hypothetical protein